VRGPLGAAGLDASGDASGLLYLVVYRVAPWMKGALAAAGAEPR
jgi:hypothetical protein